MSQNKSIFRINSIFPYSTYVTRSESPNFQSKPERDEEEFQQLIKGLGFKDRPFKKIPFRATKHPQVTQITTQPPKQLNEVKKKYRTRQTKTVMKSHSYSPEKKDKITTNKSLTTFYRYQLVSLFALLNRRQLYILHLRGRNHKFDVDPLKPNQIEERLTKQLESKGKDKGRQKFNYLLSEQMRSIKYKPRYANQKLSPKKSKLEDLEEEPEVVEHEYNNDYQLDMQAWKRKYGVGYYQKVFVVKGGYAELRRTLIERGWYENEDVWSPHFDLKWTTRICDINYMALKNHQSVNHFNNNHHLTSKYGLSRRLRTLILPYSIDIDRFYPRCYDLGDQTDFQNFIENFKFSFAESVARRFLVDKKRYRNRELKIRLTADILRRRVTSLAAKIDLINKCEYPVISADQWEIITQTVNLPEEEKQQRIKELSKIQSFEGENEEQVYKKIDKKVKEYIQILKRQDPQIEMNGFRNVWICKPNFMSRGIGIRCYNNLYDIIDYCCGGTGQFVVQKYIEHPLVIEDKKFDIRQWVLIQDFCPPKIWFYEDCYIRFCADDFSLENIYNRHIHLTNNSVQKYNKSGNIDKSMWSMGQFAEYVGEQRWKTIQQKMKNIVVWSVKSCEGYVMGRKGSCEFVGYDFMIDENYDPWLIEINMSPSMEHSTPITKRMVKRVLNDVGKVISSSKRNRDTGAFKCIYEGNADLQKYSLYKF